MYIWVLLFHSSRIFTMWCFLFTTDFLQFWTHRFSSLPLHILFVYSFFALGVSLYVFVNVCKRRQFWQTLFSILVKPKWKQREKNTQKITINIYLLFIDCVNTEHVVLVLWRPVSVFLFCSGTFLIVLYACFCFFFPPKKNSKSALIWWLPPPHTQIQTDIQISLASFWSKRIFIVIALPYQFLFHRCLRCRHFNLIFFHLFLLGYSSSKTATATTTTAIWTEIPNHWMFCKLKQRINGVR